MCMTELCHKHDDHQPLQTTMYEIRVKETVLVTKNVDLEKINKRLEENLYDVYEKIDWMYEKMNTYLQMIGKLIYSEC